MIVHTCGECQHFDSTVAMRYIYSDHNGVVCYKDDPTGGLCLMKSKATRATSVECGNFQPRDNVVQATPLG